MIRPDVPANHRCPCDPDCRHMWLDDMGGLDSDYCHCHTCGRFWPCQHTRAARQAADFHDGEPCDCYPPRPPELRPCDEYAARVATVACEWCGRAIHRGTYWNEPGWLAVKGTERGYHPLYCDAADDTGRHEPPAQSGT